MNTPPNISAGPPLLTKAELDASPHEIYQFYRGRYPFIEREDGAFLILRADDVQMLLVDPRTRQIETEMMIATGITSGPLLEFVSYSMLFANGDVHRRRRRPLTRNFAFRMMADLRPKVRALARELRDKTCNQATFKLRDDYAALIPAITIAGILGIPASDVPFFTSLVYQVSKILSTSWKREELPDMEAAARELIDYTARLIVERRRSPSGDFLSDYVAQVYEAGEMSPVEAVIQIVSVIIGGSDTTRAGIVIQTALLLERPKLWETLSSNPDLIQLAVAESLRYEPAAASIPRLAIDDIVLDGHRIAAGSRVLLATMSSMRDPKMFVNPADFDIHRDQPRWHPVFGGGEHRCLGEALARIELEEALAVLTEAESTLEFAGESLRVLGHAGIRRVGELNVRWS
jgi:cytochrome P450 family 103